MAGLLAPTGVFEVGKTRLANEPLRSGGKGVLHHG